MYNYDREVSMGKRAYSSLEGLTFGKGDKGQEVRVPKQFLEGHMLILGKSGTGKSSLLRNMIKELSAEPTSNIILLDPHGALLDDVISERNTGGLVYITPGTFSKEELKFAVSLNMIGTENTDDEEIERTTGWLRDMMATEESISGGVWGPRLEVIFRVILPELFRQKGGVTLLELVNTLTGRKEMKEFIASIKDKARRKFIEAQFQDWRNWNQYISSTLNRLLPLLSSDSTRHLVSGERDSVDIYGEMREGGRLFALNISKSSFPDEIIKIITSLFLLKVWTSVLKGFGNNGEKVDTYIFIDEFQAIPARIIETLLREGRKFGIKLVLASQYINHNSRELKQSVFGNVRNFISFNLSDSDAAELSRMLPEKRAQIRLQETIKSQKFHKAVLFSLTSDGISGPVSFKPHYENPQVDRNLLEIKKRDSVEKYSSRIQEDYAETPVRTAHEKILDGLESSLLRNGIELLRSVKLGNSIADGLFRIEGKEFVVEVEVSDISNKYRLLSKLSKHRGRNILLISPPGQAEIMHRMIVSPTSYKIRDGFALEIPLADGNRNLYARDIADSLANTTLLECGDGTLRTYWKNKTRAFLLKHLKGKSTFQRELDSGENSGTKNYIYDMMVKSEVYAVRKSDLIENSPIRKGHMERFIRSHCQVESDFVFLEDLFR